MSVIGKNNKAIIISLVLAVALGWALISLRSFFQINSLSSETKLLDAQIKALSVEDTKHDYMSEGDMPYIMRELISYLPRRAGVEVQKIIPQKIKPSGDVKSFPIEVELVASLANIEKYIFGLNVFKTPVYVDRLILKRLDDKLFAAKVYLSLLLVAGKPTVVVKTQALTNEAKVPTVKRTSAKKRVEERTVPEKLLVLQGIFGGSNKKAIINDNVVGVGDSVNGYLVKSVGLGSVTLEKSGKIINIDLQ
jgi:hypothetical protein